MKVYVVYRNSDMTEGRGPMVLDKIFLHEESAWKYADSQLGVMGHSPKYTNRVTGEIYTSWRDWEFRGEWDVREMEVDES